MHPGRGNSEITVWRFSGKTLPSFENEFPKDQMEQFISEMLGARSILNLRILHVHHVKSQGWDPTILTRFTDVSDIPYYT